MHTAPLPPCQPGRRTAKKGGALLAAGALFCFGAGFVPDAAALEDGTAPVVPASPAPTPPEWQRDLAALAVIRVAAAIAPGRPDAEGKTPSQRLAEAYRQLGEKYLSQPEVQKACGDFFYAAGDQAETFRFWLRAQALDPGDARLAQTLGEAYLQTGNTRNAAAQYQRAVDAQPGEARYHTDLANVLYLFRKELVDPPALPDAEAVLVRALEHFRLAAQLSPASRELAQAYAETFYLLAKPDWTQALAAWQTVLGLSGEHTDFANLQLARVSLGLQRPKEAEAYLDRVQHPDFGTVQTKLREQARKMEAAKDLPH